jgi:hypothetical protein
MNNKPYEEFGIKANICADDKCFRMGAKCWIVGGAGGKGADKFEVMGLNHKGRTVIKWIRTEKLDNFRAGYLPFPVLARINGGLFFQGSRKQMEDKAVLLNEFKLAQSKTI